MARFRLTAQELKRKKQDLARFMRFLPTLTLKKLQLQIELDRVGHLLDDARAREAAVLEQMGRWIAVLGEDAGFSEVVRVEGIDTHAASVAGVEIPVFETIRFSPIGYDLHETPLWFDKASDSVRELLGVKAEIRIGERQQELIERELRTTIQRVNLFEKIKIPRTREQIRAIQVFLGDQQTAAVVRGKLAKLKVARRAAEGSRTGGSP